MAERVYVSMEGTDRPTVRRVGGRRQELLLIVEPGRPRWIVREELVDVVRFDVRGWFMRAGHEYVRCPVDRRTCVMIGSKEEDGGCDLRAEQQARMAAVRRADQRRLVDVVS